MITWVDEALQFQVLYIRLDIKRVNQRLILIFSLLDLTSIKSSTVISSFVTGSLPLSAIYFSINLFSKTLPDFKETTGSLGASPETKENLNFSHDLIFILRSSLLAQNMVKVNCRERGKKKVSEKIYIKFFQYAPSMTSDDVVFS
jgi:hypothetical protein